MASYYDTNKATTANSKRIIPLDGEQQHFPSEGLYLGDLNGGGVEMPALFDLNAGKGLCMLYNDSESREKANRCLERLAWRIAVTVPSNLCDLILFNGGFPGDAFNTHVRMNKYLFDNRNDKLFYDGNLPEFLKLLSQVYSSIVERMSAIRMEGKMSMYELNESLGDEAKWKYEFIILTDFPRNLTSDTGCLLSKIVEAGAKAGIFVMMSWDIKADFVNSDKSGSTFNSSQMLSAMEILLPQGSRYYFKNTSNDEAFNRLNFMPDCAPVDYVETEQYLGIIENLVQTAKAKSKPKVLKADFESLEKSGYVPAINNINVSVGLDVRDKHPISFCFNSKDFIHGFILGQSGSGKSVLLNTIITSAILKYSPQDLMLYLMDFKGVEFNSYRNVKHTRAVLVDSNDPQMTLEVLRELFEEDKERRKLWSKEGVKSIDGYNSKHPDHRMPRIMFVADECQVMFKQSSNDSERIILKEISDILTHIAKIGRSQGIHMLLATQQLGEVNIPNDIIENLTECFLLMSAPADSERLVPGSSDMTCKQQVGIACYYHKKEFQGQAQTFYASDEELRDAITAAQRKAGDLPGNGEYYFSGSAQYSIADAEEPDLIDKQVLRCPTAFVGHDIGITGRLTSIPLNRDYSENILIFGANKEWQSVGVAVSALQTLMRSYGRLGKACDFKVIDCYQSDDAGYRKKLEDLQEKGLCEIVERTQSGTVLGQLANDIYKQTAQPTVLMILGSERFAEMKRNIQLPSVAALSNKSDMGFGLSSDVVNMDFFCDDNGDTSGFEGQIRAESDRLSSMDFSSMDSEEEKTVARTYPEALRYILDEGSMQDVHILLQADKPTNILFEDYPDQTVGMFRHKVILKSENKCLTPMRFNVDIDVENLSDETERLRAYYYPEGGTPRLFTPYVLDKE